MGCGCWPWVGCVVCSRERVGVLGFCGRRGRLPRTTVAVQGVLPFEQLAPMGCVVVLAWGKSEEDGGAGVGCDHVDFGG